MAYWLMKSEPEAYSWQQLLQDKRTSWNGVRNYLANNHMKAMRLGDQAFFYHSNQQRAIIGVMKIVGLWRLDPDDARQKFGMVEVAPVKTLHHAVDLAVIKAHPALSNMVFVRQSRLSVSPVTPDEWQEVLVLSVGARSVSRR